MRFLCGIAPRLSGALEQACAALIQALRDGQDTVERARTLGTTVEYALCDAFRSIPETAHYWVDGIEMARVELVSSASVHAQGLGWCADDRSQWQVPIQMLIDFGGGPPFAISEIEVRVGDAEFADLRGHAAWKPKKSSLPDEWLYAFVLQPRAAGAQ